MAERFSALSRTPAGISRKPPKPRDGSSKNCDKWGMRFCMVGHAASRRKKNKNTTLSQGGTGRKKNLYWHTRLGKIEIAEEVFTQGRGGPEIRPFCASAEVQCRGYSEGL